MLSALIAGGLLTALASVIGYGVSTYGNRKSVESTNKANQAINQQNLDFQAAQTQAAWERDDNYYQRSVADLEKAGLSPLAINGSMPSTAPLGSPSPIAMEAPQMDQNALVQALISSAQLGETSRHNKATEKYQSGLLENQSEEIKLKMEQLKLDDKKLNEDIRYHSKLIEIQNDELDEIIRSHKKNEEIALNEYEQRVLEHQTEAFYKEVNAMAGGADVPRNVYSDFDVFKVEWQLYVTKYNNFLDKIGATSFASAESHSKNGNAGMTAAGTGATIGAGATDSTYSSENLSEKQRAMINEFRIQNPVPVYIPKGKYSKVNY